MRRRRLAGSGAGRPRRWPGRRGQSGSKSWPADPACSLRAAWTGGAGRRRRAVAGRRRRAARAARRCASTTTSRATAAGRRRGCRCPSTCPRTGSCASRCAAPRRTDTAPNHLEVKLVDPSGDNVWWHVDRDLAWPDEWTPTGGEEAPGRIRLGTARQPPGGPGELRTAGGAGAGDHRRRRRRRLAVDRRPRAGRDAAAAAAGRAAAGERRRGRGGPAGAPSTARRPRSTAMRHTAWRPRGALPAALTVDLRGSVPMGALTLRWEPGRSPRRAAVERSDDGERWTRDPHRRAGRSGPTGSRPPRATCCSATSTPGSCASASTPATARGAAASPRWWCDRSSAGASPNAFFQALAAEAPRGSYPRGFTEAETWTVVGVDGAAEEALVSEDGAVEVGERGVSLEPFVRLDGRLWGWADVDRRALARRRRPADPDRRLAAARACASRSPRWPRRWEAGTLCACGRWRRRTLRPLAALPAAQHLGVSEQAPSLLLAARPFQVNPPYQFLNVAGGVTRVPGVTCEVEGGGLKITQGEENGGGAGGGGDDRGGSGARPLRCDALRRRPSGRPPRSR